MEGKGETPQHMNSANIAYVPLALLRQDATASKITAIQSLTKMYQKTVTSKSISIAFEIFMCFLSST